MTLHLEWAIVYVGLILAARWWQKRKAVRS